MLFHISMEDHLDEKILEPRIPESANSKYEDTSTPRICFSETINGCLQAVRAGYSIDTHSDALGIKKYNELLSDGTHIVDGENRVNIITDQFCEALYKDPQEMDALNYYDLKTKNLAYSNQFPFYYVYTPVTEILQKDCKIAPVYDQKYTHEIWVLKPVRLRKIATLYLITGFNTGEVYVNSIVGTERHKFRIPIIEYVYKLMSPNYSTDFTRALDEALQSRIYQGSEYKSKT